VLFNAASGLDEAGPRLRKFRLVRWPTPVDVADRSDVTTDFLSLLERGRFLARPCASGDWK